MQLCYLSYQKFLAQPGRKCDVGARMCSIGGRKCHVVVRRHRFVALPDEISGYLVYIGVRDDHSGA
ncbi:hypothetical protein H8B06_20280 [Sphingobacterium sp. DN00404]|uniref:Uncharacterized protein n=1 Tax=Sphingobacterium micropteri TaxID=2763501 RepID=A0ABR7YV00_9SPHI|nr:hypothetical protein [Sphingobacterium micropteri]MBD1435168.1 hypothetical protein [Sphingobacterium micropteri]